MKVPHPFGWLFGSGVEKQMKLKKHDFKSKIVKMSIRVDRNKSIPTSTNTCGKAVNGVADSKKKKLIANLSTKKVMVLQRATSKDFLSDGSFQEAVGSVLALAQCFAVMPLKGVKSRDVNNLRFTWRSIRTVYTGIMFLFTCVNALMTLMFLASGSIEFLRIVPVVFYWSNAYAMISFCLLGRKWPAIMKQWHAVEKQLPPLQNQYEKRRMAKNIKIISIGMVTLSLIEHLLSIVTSIQNATKCKRTADPVENVMIVELPHVFFFTTYTPIKAIIAKLVNISATFIWTYMDLFVIVISIGLGSRFRQINEIMVKHKGQDMPEAFWTTNRIHYRNICDLCETIDNEIGHITLAAFSNNLWFICVQLLFSLNDQPSLAHAFYFWYSLIFLIVRTLAVSLYSAIINDESREPLKIFRVVPPQSWCLEIKRFSNEITRDIVALSGMRFFHLTRSLVLSVAGTIITYELVLVQFHTGEYNRGECELEIDIK